MIGFAELIIMGVALLSCGVLLIGAVIAGVIVMNPKRSNNH